MKTFASDIFNLSGKITEQHSKEIDEVLESLLSQANTAGALKMFDYISKEYKWDESREFKKSKEYYIYNVIDKILCKKK